MDRSKRCPVHFYCPRLFVVLLCWLWLGVASSNSFTYRIGRADSSMCDNCNCVETIDHHLCRCMLFQTHRRTLQCASVPSGDLTAGLFLKERSWESVFIAHQPRKPHEPSCSTSRQQNWVTTCDTLLCVCVVKCVYFSLFLLPHSLPMSRVANWTLVNLPAYPLFLLSLSFLQEKSSAEDEALRKRFIMNACLRQGPDGN